uniref:Major capsid protein n=1 Tax=Dulem virus 132 TaxID=3145609 RepID=A0AAU8B3M2_9VIRU
MAKGYRNTLFTRVKTPRPSVNKFDLSHDKMLTVQMGKLYPVLCQEMVPGDRFRVQSDFMCRTMPLVSPAFGSLKAYVHYFFVPNRLLWDGWENFITGGEDGTDRPVPPYVTYSDFIRDIHNFYGVTSNIGLGLLGDYFGLPISDSFGTANETPVSLLPFRAYALIWNEYYRDQNVDSEIDIEFEVGGRIPLGSSSSSVYTFNYHRLLRSRRWLKDYFTSALPTPQRGPDVTLPIAGQANVVLSETNNAGRFVAPNSAAMAPPDRYDVIASNINTPTSGYGISAAPSKTEAGYSLTYDPNGSLKADLSTATAVTINDLRRAIALQKFYEISARSGARYKETIMGHFHVTSSDARLQRPEYLGGGVSTINISEVLQTSATGDTSPQGNLAGKGFGIGRSNRSSFFAEEHGYMIGILSIVPDAIYFQGINKSWNRLNQEDYYWPSFAHLGEQPILKSELYAPTDSNTFSQLFGYAPRYAEYKYAPSTIHGLFRTQLANWTFARKLSAANLNSEFLTVPDINNPFAVQDATDKYLIWISHRIDALRPMPFFGTPSI